MTVLGLASCLTATAGTAQATTTAGTAQVAALKCTPTLNKAENKASVKCTGGGGYYRVKAQCSQATYPYVTTIYGPWKYDGKVSTVYGKNYNCHVTSAAAGF